MNSKTNVAIDVNGITDFQNMPEYFNNKKLVGIFVFESDIRENPHLIRGVFSTLFSVFFDVCLHIIYESGKTYSELDNGESSTMANHS